MGSNRDDSIKRSYLIALREHGPMTAPELAKAVGTNKDAAGANLSGYFRQGFVTRVSEASPHGRAIYRYSIPENENNGNELSVDEMFREIDEYVSEFGREITGLLDALHDKIKEDMAEQNSSRTIVEKVKAALFGQ